MKVAVANSDLTQLDLLSKFFREKFGFIAFTYKDGFEIYDSIRNGIRFDLVIMDVVMPTMDGITTSIYIRNLALAKQPPIVLVTGEYNPVIERMAFGKDVMAQELFVKSLHGLEDFCEMIRFYIPHSSNHSKTITLPASRSYLDLILEQEKKFQVA